MVPIFNFFSVTTCRSFNYDDTDVFTKRNIISSCKRVLVYIGCDRDNKMDINKEQ